MVLRESVHFSRRYALNKFHILDPQWTFNLLTLKSLCQLIFVWVTSLQSLNVVSCSVIELTIGMQ